MRFLHAADIHLGYRQYNSDERFKDFSRAFSNICNLAVEQEAQVCLIAGDFFEKSSIDPTTLLQAENGLSQLRDAGIMTLAIAGNHDRLRYRETKSWLDYLHAREMLTLLEPGERGWVSEGDNFLDIDGVRFIGMPYYGSGTEAVIGEIIKELPQQNWDGIRCTVMMMHAAIEGQIPNIAGALRFDTIDPLREFVDYLALGHLHKPYQAPSSEPWIYNPGAIENRSFDEAKFVKKGVFIVDVDESGNMNVRKHVIQGRSFQTVTLKTDRYGNADQLRDGIFEAVEKEAASWPEGSRPVVNLKLSGNLSFDRSTIDLESIRQRIETQFDCLIVRINTYFDPFGFDREYDEQITPQQLEEEVFEDIALSDTRFSTNASAWGDLMRQVKQDVLAGQKPEIIYDALDNHMTKEGEA